MGWIEQQQISKYFPGRPILYISGLGTVFSPNAGIFLSQLLYWHGKGSKKGGWIYKTAEDVFKETGLTRNNQETVIKLLLKHGVIEYKLAGVPAKRHFRVNMAALHEVLPSLKASCKLNYPNPPSYVVDKGETITKITRDTTTKNTIHKLSKDNFLAERNKLAQLKSLRGP